MSRESLACSHEQIGSVFSLAKELFDGFPFPRLRCADDETIQDDERLSLFNHPLSSQCRRQSHPPCFNDFLFVLSCELTCVLIKDSACVAKLGVGIATSQESLQIID